MSLDRTPRLLVVDPSVSWPEEVGVREILGDWRGAATVLRPALSPGDGPAPGFGYDTDGVVVMGSRASANDGHPWLEDLGDWLDPLLAGQPRIPVLGICFGHQLIARRAGGRVGWIHGDRSVERGIQETAFERCRLVPRRERMPVVASHAEEVKEVPRGYRVVAHRSSIAVDALESERFPVFTVQFHPEARLEFLARRGVDIQGIDPSVFEPSVRLLSAFRRIVLESIA